MRRVEYDLEKRLINFSIAVISLCEKTDGNFAKEHLSKQLIRSATSAALNYGEAQSATSTKDFIHKMGISLKELRESQVNLKIQEGAGLIRNSENLKNIITENNELIAIFVKSIQTAKRNFNKNKT